MSFRLARRAAIWLPQLLNPRVFPPRIELGLRPAPSLAPPRRPRPPRPPRVPRETPRPLLAVTPDTDFALLLGATAFVDFTSTSSPLRSLLIQDSRLSSRLVLLRCWRRRRYVPGMGGRELSMSIPSSVATSSSLGALWRRWMLYLFLGICREEWRGCLLFV